MTSLPSVSRALWFLTAFISLLLSQSVQAASTTGSSASDSPYSVLHRVTGDIKIGPSIAAIIAIALGTVLCFAGYRLIRPALFVCGFLLAGLVGSLVVENVLKHHSWVTTASWIIFVVAGLLGGLLVISLCSLGIFAAGATGGVFLACAINASIGNYWYPHHTTTGLIVLAVVLGILCGYLAYVLERPVLIIATSYVGAQTAVWGVGYFAGSFPSAADLDMYRLQNSSGEWVYRVPDAWWGYLAAIVVIFVLGMVVQFSLTSKHITHTHHHRHLKRTRQEEMYRYPLTPQENARRGDPVTLV